MRTTNQTISIAIILTVFILGSFPGRGATESADQIAERDRMVYAKQKEYDMALMRYRSIILENNDKAGVRKAQFAVGEYNFMADNSFEARRYFEEYLNYPQDHNGKMFAQAYMMKIALDKGDEAIVEQMKKEIITYEQQSYIFRDDKKYEYISPLDRVHLAVYSIDKVEVFVEEELLLEIVF